MNKIARVELYMFPSETLPTEVVGSFIEMAVFCAESNIQKVVIVLTDGTKITFPDADISNGLNEVEISQ